MHSILNRTAPLATTILLLCLLGGGASAEDRKIYPGASVDERVANCGVIVTEEMNARIEPFLESRGDLEGRVVLEVSKQSASGESRSHQASDFSNGKPVTMTISIDRPAEAMIALSVTDRSGKTLCKMRRAITLGETPMKI
jgi:hypothetical protein